jgi:hydrogenase nickel incorporation protein HypA/HybF
MHELGIAQQLIEQAHLALPAQAAQVTALTVRLGPLAGLSAAELRFGFEVVRAGTPFADAELTIEAVPVRVWCPLCQVESAVADLEPVQCPRCEERTVRIVQGKELILQSLAVRTKEIYDT